MTRTDVAAELAMLSSSSITPPAPAPPAERPGFFLGLAQRHPFWAVFVIVIFSNVFSTVFNFLYNIFLIVEGILDAEQKFVYWNVVSPAYNMVAYPICLGLLGYLLWPIVRCRRQLLANEPVPAAELQYCRRRLINLPTLGMGLNFMGWLPGAIVFPLVICSLGGDHEAGWIWTQFGISFVVSALLTTLQTFFPVETLLIRVLYPDFFKDARPADVPGVWRVSFRWRLILLWCAIALGPLLALLAVTINFLLPNPNYVHLITLAIGVFSFGVLTGGLIFWFVGRDVLRWIETHAKATAQVAEQKFDVRIRDQRPDEWGRLTDRFNDMADALQHAQKVRDTFGEAVGPDVRDAMLERYPGLKGDVQEVTVLFADIRGFTRRSSGEPPDRVVELLNRFLSLATRAMEKYGGSVKFLGDGLMALFGATRLVANHADEAVAAACELLRRLERLNEDLVRQGQETLNVGIGIHTGPALVGCIGAVLPMPGGGERLRKEFTAIGETVNLSQRVEQLTKTCGGPILLTGQTQARLADNATLTSLGPQTVPGREEPLMIFRLELR
jgi:adenylate cyclase